MSRVGRLPIAVPSGVNITIEGAYIKVKGPKGELERSFSGDVSIHLEDNVITVQRPNDQPRMRAMHGMTRALINNMVVGVSKGFERVLEVNGVGYRAEMDGDKLVLYVGYSHPVKLQPPAGIKFEADTRARQIKVLGFDKELVGQWAANIREVRPPEPYKGKGIKYLEEIVRRKAGKAGKV